MYLYVLALVWAAFLILMCLGMSVILRDLVWNRPHLAIFGTILTMVPAFLAGCAHRALILLT